MKSCAYKLAEEPFEGLTGTKARLAEKRSYRAYNSGLEAYIGS